MSGVEKYLVLNNYFLNEVFGVGSLKDVRDALVRAKPGVDGDGVSYFCRTLMDEMDNLKLDSEKLLHYDRNIQSYVRHVNGRRNNVTLKYFQYLAVLLSEIYMDRLTNDRNAFVNDLNNFLHKYMEDARWKKPMSDFTAGDLNKMAFWMATGSGKTIIMHINYLQFMKYRRFEPQNVLLLTPNEGLSDQHYEELLKSSIPASLYHGNPQTNGINSGNFPGQVLVIEITKLKEDKKGRGVTLPVDAFEGPNLVLVDEGHKGRTSEDRVWARLRDALGDGGFTFEYSATFGQILDEKDWNTMQEYGKSIIFDYSYKYFYNDQYGKDFKVMNVSKVSSLSSNDFSRVMFTANLLSYYEQLVSYDNSQELAISHNLEKPLWIFVGATVQGESSDVALVTRFFSEAADGTLKEIAGRILSGLYLDDNGQDIFGGRFVELRRHFAGSSHGYDVSYLPSQAVGTAWLDDLWADLMQRVFHGHGQLRVAQLINAQGEFGLRVGDAPYFGVISVGQDSGLGKALRNDGIEPEKDVITNSLFDQIKEPDSHINVLLGSRKFIEGWDTWRVSSMGLLNMGRGQGPQIIQLFGRGVRIKGKNMSLQRSGDSQLALLETLFIYGIKANYLQTFLESVKKEGVDYQEVQVPIQPRHQDKWRELLVPIRSVPKPFEETVVLHLSLGAISASDGADDEEKGKTHVELDLSPQIKVYDANRGSQQGPVRAQVLSPELDEEHSISTSEAKMGKSVVTPLPAEEYAEFVDWSSVYAELLRFKAERGYWNLVFDASALKSIWTNGGLTIRYPGFKVNSLRDLSRLQEVVTQGIKKYVDAFYGKAERRWKTENMKTASLEDATGASRQLSLFTANEEQMGYYVVKVPSENKAAIEKLNELVRMMQEETSGSFDNANLKVADGGKLVYANVGRDSDDPFLDFDELVIVPLLSKTGLRKLIGGRGKGDEEPEARPTPLNEGEEKFLKKLHDHVRKNGVPEGYVPYALRNQTRTGVGFQLEWAGFYPDFILWLTKPGDQIIVFVDPHGLAHAHGMDDEKITFCEKEIKQRIEKQLRRSINKAARPGQSGPTHISLDAFLISTTPYDELVSQRPDMDKPRAVFEKKHVLFMEDPKWPEKMLEMAIEGSKK